MIWVANFFLLAGSLVLVLSQGKPFVAALGVAVIAYGAVLYSFCDKRPPTSRRGSRELDSEE